MLGDRGVGAIVIALAALAILGLFATNVALAGHGERPVDELGLFPDEDEAGERSSHEKPGESLGAFRNYTEMTQVLEDLEAEHPELVEVQAIGTSVEGREIWMATVTPPAEDDRLTEVLFDAAHHGNEVIASEVTLRMLEDLVTGYGDDPTMTEAVDGNEIHLVPQVNVDGVSNIPNCDWYGDCRKNANGVDLNRNYGYHWGERGASDNPDSATYHGPEAFSEPESRAIKGVVDENNIAVHWTTHSGTTEWLWPWGFTQDRPPEHAIYEEFGQALADETGFGHGQSSHVLYYASGNGRDYTYGASAGAHPLAFTPEVYGGDEGGAYTWWPFFNPPEDEIDDVYLNMQSAFLHAIEVSDRYSDPVIEATVDDPTPPTSTISVSLANEGERVFTDGTLSLEDPTPGLSIPDADGVEVGTLETGEQASVDWTIVPERHGTQALTVNASSSVMGNWTRDVSFEVPYGLNVSAGETSPLPGSTLDLDVYLGAVEHETLEASWTLEVDGDTAAGSYHETLAEDTVSVQDEGWVLETNQPFATEGLSDGTYTATLTLDYEGVREGQTVEGTLTNSHTWTLERPEIHVDKALEGASLPGQPVPVSATFENRGSLAAQDVRIEESIPAGYVLAPTLEGSLNPYDQLAEPAPSSVTVAADGTLDVRWEPDTLAPGEAFAVAYELVPLVPGTHVHTSTSTYEHAYATETIAFEDASTVEHRVGPAP